MHQWSKDTFSTNQRRGDDSAEQLRRVDLVEGDSSIEASQLRFIVCVISQIAPQLSLAFALKLQVPYQLLPNRTLSTWLLLLLQCTLFSPALVLRTTWPAALLMFKVMLHLTILVILAIVKCPTSASPLPPQWCQSKWLGRTRAAGLYPS
jgi:hypothetical protein